MEALKLHLAAVHFLLRAFELKWFSGPTSLEGFSVTGHERKGMRAHVLKGLRGLRRTNRSGHTKRPPGMRAQYESRPGAPKAQSTNRWSVLTANEASQQNVSMCG